MHVDCTVHVLLITCTDTFLSVDNISFSLIHSISHVAMVTRYIIHPYNYIDILSDNTINH